MDTVYKLTTQDNKTRAGEKNECIWGPNVTHSGTGKGYLCGPGFIHAYLSPELAVLLNPIHANIQNPRLWRCKTDIVKRDRGLKVGGVSLTTVEEITLPSCTTRQRIIFAILCARAVGFSNKTWNEWANNFIAGKKDAADAAAYAAARAAARAAASAAAYAAYAARAAASAAAAYAARAASAAASDAAYAARAASAAASDAAYAADAASDAAYAVTLNLVNLAKQALTYE